jgi:glutathione S-transferase
VIIVHHLNDSRSQRILWLLEELQLPYEIKFYVRDPATRAAPRELRFVHALGKSPVISDGTNIIAESGAVIDYIIRRHGGGRMQPDPGSDAYDFYVQWLHYAEASASFPLALKGFLSRLGVDAAPLLPQVELEIANHLSYINQGLEGRPYLMGKDLSGACRTEKEAIASTIAIFHH